MTQYITLKTKLKNLKHDKNTKPAPAKIQKKQFLCSLMSAGECDAAAETCQATTV